MSWTCPSCRETFQGPCYHACGLPKVPKAPSPLARVKKTEGRVDLLIARLLEEATAHARNPLVAKAYSEVKPFVETLLTKKLGPRTKRGKKLASDLFTLRDLLQQVQEQRRNVA